MSEIYYSKQMSGGLGGRGQSANGSGTKGAGDARTHSTEDTQRPWKRPKISTMEKAVGDKCGGEQKGVVRDRGGF